MSQTSTAPVSSAAALTAAQLAAQKGLNPQAAKSAESAAAPAPTVLRTGETVNSDLAGLQSGKTYYHRIAGARTVMPDGREIVFAGGIFATADADILAELDKVADRPASQIYTKRDSVESAKAVEQRLAADAADTAGTDGK